MALPLVAIVGRPNVGKSTLFNRITRTREAVVHEDSGVTRDRHVHVADWNGVPFTLADTGGIVPHEEGSLFEQEISEIARHTIELADAVLFLVDVGSGITAFDQAIARELRGSDRPVLLVVNKADGDVDQLESGAFYKLGLGEPHPLSALHGRGTGDLLDALTAVLPTGQPEPKGELRVALLGRPNVGKSSLLNTLVGEQRSLVSDVPGTTRDAIDTRIRWHGHDIVLVDTAGIRRRYNHGKGIEYFSVLRSIQAVQRCDVAVLMLDATEGVVAQDARVAGEIHDAAKGVLIAINKWDAIEKETMTYKRFEEDVRDELAFLSYAPVVTISALERTRSGRILEGAWEVAQERKKTVETSALNAILELAKRKNPPQFHNRGNGKVYYGTQTGTGPPAFTIFVNKIDFFPRHYIRYLNNQIREAFGFKGTRIRVILRERR